MSSGLLQIFLIVNVFIMGGLATFGGLHLLEHFRQKKHKGTGDQLIPEEQRKKLLVAAEAQYQRTLEQSSKQLQQDLGSTTKQLNTLLEKIGTDLVEREMKLYHESLDDVMQQTKTITAEAQQNLIKHQAELEKKLSERQAGFEAKLNELQTTLETTLTNRQAELDRALAERRGQLEAQLEKEMTAQKTFMMQQIDTKAADVLASFLTETLQHEVDLGAQEAYLLSQLEAHKEELKREVGA
ncbi:TPA: hypothetical protein DIV49_01330 [Candidatus Saccharibacteria bacterium]|nr:hypothetical protein [Candidatus Saccharibacteria bacterium]HRJ90909.1 hypothetical protein [Candidatus Saccharibacteria bacterium]